MAKILFVDDEPLIRSEAAELLSMDGHEILHAGNGLDALDLLRDHQVDLMVLDMMMPELNGLETIKEIRGEEFPINQVKILAISNGGNSFDPQLILKSSKGMGANDVLPKPFSFEELQGKISILLS